MTEVCLKAKGPLQTGTWSNISTGFNTGSKSCLFIKQLTSTCISTILHLRKILPDDYFEEKGFGGITLKLLKSRKGENYVSQIEQWLEGAFEAMDKKYLKCLMLDIQDPESDTTLEIYSMTYNYNEEKEGLNGLLSTTRPFNRSDYTVANTRLNTVKLLQMCHAVTETYSNLPSKVKLSMKLSYYDNTPEDYNPRGYEAWEPVDPKFQKQPRGIEIGTTSTQYHSFRLFNKSCFSGKFLKDLEVRCACLSSDKTETMFTCLGCKNLVHAECYGILKVDSTKRVRFYCHLCHGMENNFKCHDKVIMSLKNSSDQQKLSLLRRILRHCNMRGINTITLKKMEKILGPTCPTKLVNIVLNKMIEIGVLVVQGKKKTYLIDKKVLTEKMVHYFYKLQHSNESQSQKLG